MKKEALVSIVLPIYNVEKYLNRCVLSIISQTYKNLEIIMVDDESTDLFSQMCDEWASKDSRIKVIHKKNEGLGFARNTGIENATGDFICFIDSDDYIESDTIKTCVERIEKDNTDLAVFGFRSVNDDGTINFESVPCSPKSVYRNDEVQDTFLPQLIAPVKGDWGLMMSSCCCLYSMNLLEKTSFRFVSEREIISEDVYSLLKLYKDVSGVSVICKAFYNYCVNENSLTHIYRKDRYQKIKHFYLEGIKLCNSLGYSADVIRAMQGPYISFTIAAIKHVVKSNEKFREKKAALNNIVTDDLLQELINSDNLWVENKKKKVLFGLIKFKCIYLMYFIVRLKND